MKNIKIKFIGVWDTVGSLGIPYAYLFGWKDIFLNWFICRSNLKYSFHDTNLHPNVEYAFHAYLLPLGS